MRSEQRIKDIKDRLHYLSCTFSSCRCGPCVILNQTKLSEINHLLNVWDKVFENQQKKKGR